MPKKTREPDPDRLVRETAGSYLSEDGRFRVRSDSGGAWYVADTARVNELGLELVLGPLATIAAAREAVSRQRREPAGIAPEDLPEPTPAKGGGRKGERARALSGSASAEPEASEAEPEPPRPKPVVRRAPWHRTGDDRDAVAEAFRRINDAWTDGEPERMSDDLNERVVMVQPGFAQRLEGRDAAIASFRDFMEGAIVHEYGESDLVIHVSGTTAVATSRWEIDWEAGDERHRDRGHDVYVFGRERGRWRAVWRVLVPESG